MTTRQDQIRELLARSRAGDQSALDALLPLVYDDLRRVARNHLRSERAGHTLNTTALVHEAYMDLAAGDAEWRDRAHFFAVASTAMRHILVDYARRKKADKRGGDQVRVTLDERFAGIPSRSEEMLALDEALASLGARHPRLEKVVECRFFGGMTVEDTAEALDVSTRTVERDWTRTKAYLYQTLAAPDPDG